MVIELTDEMVRAAANARDLPAAIEAVLAIVNRQLEETAETVIAPGRMCRICGARLAVVAHEVVDTVDATV